MNSNLLASNWLGPSAGIPTVGETESALRRAQSWTPPSKQERVEYGQKVMGGAPGSARFWGEGLWQGNTFTPAQFLPSPPPPPGTELPQLPLTALLEDTNKMQGAADRQHARNDSQIGAINQFLNRAPGQIMGTARSGADELSGVAGRAEALGQKLYGDFNSRAGDVMSRFDRGRDTFSKDIAEGYKLGDEMVSGYQQAIRDYEDRGAQDASMLARGIRANASQQMKAARAGIHPDGSPMTPAEQHDAVFGVEMATNEQVQSALTPLLSQYNTQIAGMNQILASVRQSNASLRMTGAGIKEDYEKFGGNLASTLSGQQVQAAQNLQDMMKLSASLHQARTSALDAAQLQAVNLEMQGMTTVAQLIQQNPESVVSWFQGLLALYAAQSATAPTGGGGGGGGGGFNQNENPGQNGRGFGWNPMGGGQLQTMFPGGRGGTRSPGYSPTGTEADFFAGSRHIRNPDRDVPAPRQYRPPSDDQMFRNSIRYRKGSNG